MKEKVIKQILVDGIGWIYAEKKIDNDGSKPNQPVGTYRIERTPIEVFYVNGEMAGVAWYRQGEIEYNGKYVVCVEYYQITPND